MLKRASDLSEARCEARSEATFGSRLLSCKLEFAPLSLTPTWLTQAEQSGL